MTTNRHHPGRTNALATLLGGVLALAAAPLSAATLDPVGDFLPTFEGPRNGDLDVTGVEARVTAPGTVRLVGEHAGPIGTTAGSAYVWGVDRGQGQEFLAFGDPPVGQGVTFDAVVAIFADGTGLVADLLTGAAPAFLDPGAVVIDGATISVTLTEALLPSTGFAFRDYRYNLWPRFAPDGPDVGDNAQISDFAPDAGTVAPVPAPAALPLLGLALGGLGLLRRRP